MLTRRFTQVLDHSVSQSLCVVDFRYIRKEKKGKALGEGRKNDGQEILNTWWNIVIGPVNFAEEEVWEVRQAMMMG